MAPAAALLLNSEQVLMMLVYFVGLLLVIRVFRKLGSKPAVIIGISALCAIELLHKVRPSFHHPQNRADAWVMLFAMLLSLPLLFGTVWPLCKVAGGLCDAKVRSSYVRGALASDIVWFVVAVLAICLSWRRGWWLS